jgi:hypothetical protein
MRHRLASLAFATAVLIAGCKPDAGSAAPPAPRGNAPAAAIEAFCKQAFGATAEQALKGCTEDERAGTAARNTIEFAREPLKECRRLGAAVAADRLAFDGAAATGCLSSTTATKRVDGTWGDLAVPDLDESPACDSVFTAKQAEGQPCGSTLECKEPLTCLGATDETKADGTCKAVPAHAGEPCDSVFLRVTDFKHRPRCAEGLLCDPADDVCKPALAAGAACSHSFECTRPAACRAGRCSPAAPADVGGACEDDTDDCKPGLYCMKPRATDHPGGKSAPATQGKCAEKKPAGSACTQELFECKGECKKASEHEDGKCASRCGSG